jgi:hypothetical protein
MSECAKRGTDNVRFVFLGSCGEGQQLKAGVFHHMPDHVVLVEALLDDDDAIAGLLVEPGEQRVACPVIGFTRAQCPIGLDRASWGRRQ